MAGCRGIKILGTGELTKKLTVSAHAFSASAKREDRSQGRHLRSQSAAQSRPQAGQGLECLI